MYCMITRLIWYIATSVEFHLDTDHNNLFVVLNLFVQQQVKELITKKDTNLLDSFFDVSCEASAWCVGTGTGRRDLSFCTI